MQTTIHLNPSSSFLHFCLRKEAQMATILAPLPHFFKVVVFPADRGLKLPDAFMKKYRHELKNSVFLKVPNGEPWEVELVHDYENGCYLLQNGWKEFAEFYSIELYHLLVFQYESDSRFLVLIFDQTALEINYPPSSSDIVVKVEQELVEVIHHHQTYQTTRRGCPRTRKGKETTQVKHSNGLEKGTRKTRAKICREIFKLHEAKSSRPFFVSSMNPTNASSKTRLTCQLEIPRNFLREHLPINGRCKFLLRVNKDGVFSRNWPVFLVVNKCGRVKIGRGLYKFVKENGIKLNDVCVFELCRRQSGGGGGKVFKVTIHPSC